MSQRQKFKKPLRRRRFALEPDELYRDTRRTVVCDNSGDEDSLLFGCPQVDDRDHFEGFGVSATREAEMSVGGDWSVFVDDFDTFKYLRDQEELLTTNQGALRDCLEQMAKLGDEVEELRDEARSMLNQYGSIEPSVVRKGQYLAHRLKLLDSTKRYYERQIDTARDNLRKLEAIKHSDPDEVNSGEGGYNTVHWNQVYRSGQALIDRLSWALPRMDCPQLARQLTVVQTKRSRRELTFEHYVHLVGVLTGELYRRTGGANYLARRNKMASLWKRHQLGERGNNIPSLQTQEVLFDPSEWQFGETRLTEAELLSAIDLRADASRLEARHSITFDEAVSMLTTEWN